MAHGLHCDRCDRTLLLDESVRYEVRVIVQAAYDPMEITREDLARANAEDWQALLAELEGLSADEAQDQVYRELRFDLCPRCQREYLRDPLGTGRPIPPSAIRRPEEEEGGEGEV